MVCLCSNTANQIEPPLSNRTPYSLLSYSQACTTVKESTRNNVSSLLMENVSFLRWLTSVTWKYVRIYVNSVIDKYMGQNHPNVFTMGRQMDQSQ